MPVLDVAAEVPAPPPGGSQAQGTTLATGQTSTTPEVNPLTAAGEIDNPVAELKDLKQKAAALSKQKKELARQLRNAQRKHKRLKEKAKQLSDQDLLSVMLMRKEKKARCDNGAEAAAAVAAAMAAQAPAGPAGGPSTPGGPGSS